MAALTAEYAALGKTLTDQDIIKQLGWHPDLAVPPCTPIKPPPDPTAFKTSTPPCVTERTIKLRRMRKEIIDAAIAPTTPEEIPKPQDGDFPVYLFGACRKPGTCYPSDTWGSSIADRLSFDVLWNALTTGMHLNWVRMIDPNKAAIVDAWHQKWLSTAPPP